MLNLQQLAMSLLAKNPNIANNPRAQEMLQTIQNNDSQKGSEIAKNLCNTYGVTPEQAVDSAKKFFNIF